MSITYNIEIYYKNIIENIKKMENGSEKDLAIGSLVADIGGRCIKPIAKLLGSSFRKVKQCFLSFKENCKQLKLEFRGRKRIIVHYPNLIQDIEKVIEKYKNTDSSFKTETLYVSINPKSIIEELVVNYDYPEKFACYNTIHDLVIEMGYKFKKISKTKVLSKISETNAIFENVHEELEDLKYSNEETAAISIDDKATKKVGNISDNGKSWLNIQALDHDTTYDYAVKPFGILDLKTNESFVNCTTYSSTAKFKVDCIENYIIHKNKTNKLKRLVIFLDNGPENSGRRKLWLKSLVDISIKYDIIIKLVYYPPYHSKYNKIERLWARIQICWNKVILDNLDKMIDCLGKITWCGIKCKARLIKDKYEKGTVVTMSEIEDMNKHIIRELGLENYSIVITPFEI